MKVFFSTRFLVCCKGARKALCCMKISSGAWESKIGWTRQWQSFLQLQQNLGIVPFSG